MKNDRSPSTIIPPRALLDIAELAKTCGVEKVILFGSRARGDNRDNSDVNIAISGGDRERFAYEVDDAVWTILKFDVVDLDGKVPAYIHEAVEAEGIIIYDAKNGGAIM